MIKKYISALMVIMIMILPMGCGSTPQKKLYSTVGTAVTVVNSARLIYATLYSQGQISADLDARVSKVYTKYQVLAPRVITAVASYADTLRVNPNADPTATNVLIADLGALVGELLGLFNQAGVPADKTPQLNLQPVGAR